MKLSSFMDHLRALVLRQDHNKNTVIDLWMRSDFDRLRVEVMGFP